MDPITLALASIPSLIKGIFGGFQLSKANKLEKQNPRPTAEVAPAISQMVNYNQGLANAQDIPGGEMARNQIGGATSAGINAASQLSSGAEGIGAVGKMVMGGQQAQEGLAQQTAQYAAGNQRQYANSLQDLGQEQNRVWDYNKNQPYQQAGAMASQLRNSGMQNLFGGASNLFGAGAAATTPDFNSALASGGGYGGGKGMDMGAITKYVQDIIAKGGKGTNQDWGYQGN